MSALSMYAELRTWQQGLAALIGFVGLIVAALWNFSLNRKRDVAIRKEEMSAVAAALYGEMILLRQSAAKVARTVARVYIAAGTKPDAIIKFDKHFVEANRISEPIMYKALASKFGLLPSSLIVSITSFYENIQMIGFWLAQLPEQHDRAYSYSPLTVLKPARDAVAGAIPMLHEIECMIGVKERQSLKVLDLGEAESVIDMEEKRWAEG